MHKILIITLLLSIAAIRPSLAQDPVGQVENLSGRADARLGEQEPRPLADGDAIYRADEIRTKSDTRLDVRLLDGSVLSLDENTRLTVAEYVIDQEPSGFFDLLQGRVRSSVTDTFSERRSSFQLRTKTALMGVQGTDFLVRAEAVETRVSVFEGIIEVRNANSDIIGSVLLQPGQFTQVLVNSPPQVPAAAPVAPQAQGANRVGSGGQLDIRAGGQQAVDPMQSLPRTIPSVITPAIPNLPGRPNR